MMRSLLMEFIGTFFLVFVFMASGNALAVSAVLTLMIYVGSGISGAQYNPAVTFGLLVAGKTTNSKAVVYMIMQFVAGLAAMVAVVVLAGRTPVVSPADGVPLLHAAFAEFLFTFSLVLTVFMMMVERKHTDNMLYGVAVGLNILAGALSVGVVSGGAFNPVIGVVPQLYKLFTGDSIALPLVVLYTVAPLFGGMLAALVYGVLHAKDANAHDHKHADAKHTEERHHKTVEDLDIGSLTAPAE